MIYGMRYRDKVKLAILMILGVERYPSELILSFFFESEQQMKEYFKRVKCDEKKE